MCYNKDVQTFSPSALVDAKTPRNGGLAFLFWLCYNDKYDSKGGVTMVPKKVEETRSRVLNLTLDRFQTYTADGNICSFEPMKFGLPDRVSSSVVYVVSAKKYAEVEKTTRGTADLAFIEPYGNGRAGNELVRVRLFNGDRVYPTNKGA